MRHGTLHPPSPAPRTTRPGILAFVVDERRLLGYGFALTFLSSFGQTFFVGLFTDELRVAFGLDAKALGAVYSTATIASGLSLIYLGRRVDDIALRPFSAALVCGQAVAALLIASAPTWWALLGGFFLLRLSGQGLMGHAAATTMARYYDGRRGTALAVSSLGYAAGEAVIPPIGVWCAVAFGWRLTWTGVAAADLLVALPIVLVLLRPHARRHAAFLAARNADRAARPDAATATDDWTAGQVVRDPGFALMIPAILAPPFIVTGIFFHATALIEPRGWTPLWWSACFAGYAAAQLPSTFIAGALVDRFGARRLAVGLLVPLGLGLVVLGLVTDRIGALVFLVLAGISSGCIGPIVGSLWAEVYGVTHLGAIRAMAVALMVLATGGAPIVVGAAIDADLGLRRLALLGSAVAVVTTIGLAFGLLRAGRRQPSSR